MATKFKKILALILSLVMLVSLVSVNVFADKDNHSVGSGDPVDVTPYAGPGAPGGGSTTSDYTLYWCYDETSTKGYYTTNLNLATLTYNGSAWNFGSSQTLSSTGSATIVVTPVSGYRIAKVDMLCTGGNNTDNPYNCRTYNEGSSYSATPSGGVSITVSNFTASSACNHSSHSHKYYLMVTVEQLEEEATYTVTYKPGEGSGTDYTDNNSSAGYSFGDTYTVLGNDTTAFSRSGYTFAGWKVTACGDSSVLYNITGNEYDPADTFTMPAGNVELTAQWEKDEEPVINYTLYIYYKYGNEGNGSLVDKDEIHDGITSNPVVLYLTSSDLLNNGHYDASAYRYATLLNGATNIDSGNGSGSNVGFNKDNVGEVTFHYSQPTPPAPTYSLTTVYKTNGVVDNSSTVNDLTAAPTDPGAGSTSTYNSNTYTYESFVNNGGNSYTVTYARTTYKYTVVADYYTVTDGVESKDNNTAVTLQVETTVNTNNPVTYTVKDSDKLYKSNNYELASGQGLTVTPTTDGITLTLKFTRIVTTPKYDYSIEYYYDGVINTTKTESKNAIEGAIISTYTDNKTTGYKLDSVNWGTEAENTAHAMTVTTTAADNIIKVYYVKDVNGNDYGDASFNIYKTDGTNPMGGVTFTLTNASGTTVWTGATSSEDSNKGYATVTIDKSYLGTDNTYSFTLTETVPTGYYGAGPWTVNVNKGNVSISDNPGADGFFHNVWNWIVSVVTGESTDNKLSNGVLTVTNTAKTVYYYRIDRQYTLTTDGVVGTPVTVTGTGNDLFHSYDSSYTMASDDSRIVGYPTTDGNSDYTYVNGAGSVNGGTESAPGVITLIYSATKINNYTVSYQWNTTYSFTGLPTLPGQSTKAYGAEVTVENGYADVKASDNSGTWHFNGWTIKTEGVTANNGKFNMPAKNVVIEGSWTFNANGQYTVVYQPGDGATGTSKSDSYYIGSSYTVVGNDTTNFSKAGYTFDGWTNDSEKTNVIGDNDSSSVSTTITYTAQWTRDLGALIVTKDFSGIDALPESFKLTVTGPDGYTRDLTLDNVDQMYSISTLSDEPAYTWTLDELPTGVYTVSESGAEVDNYSLTTSGLGTVTVTKYAPVARAIMDYAPAQKDVVNTYTYNPPYIPTPDTYTLTVNWLAVGEDGNVSSTLGTTSETHNYGFNYDKSTAVDKTFDGFTYSSHNGALTGRLTSDTVINVYYVATVEIPEVSPPVTNPDVPDDDVTIEDDDTPLAPLPGGDVTIEDGEVPMAPAPQTGDSILIYIVIMFASLALGGIVLIVKKETGRSHKH